MIQLLESDGPGDTGVRFCMASALATLVLDEDVMRLLKLRGEAPMLFVHSIEILKSALAKLALDAKQPPDDPDLTVKMAEAMAQAMWGAAYYCTLPGGGGVEDHHVTSLGDLGVAAWCNTRCVTLRSSCIWYSVPCCLLVTCTAMVYPCYSCQYCTLHHGTHQCGFKSVVLLV